MAETKKKSSGNAGPAPAKRSKEPATAVPKNEQNQFWSIILFASGILLAMMVLISGSAGWHGIHKFMLGMFGVAAFFVPVILIYTAVQIGMEKSQKCVAGRAIWGVALMFLTSAAIQIFFVGELPGDRFSEQLRQLYEDGADLRGGGVASIIIAGILIRGFGSLGAKIITVIMFFVFGMLLSGLGLIEFLNMLLNPFRFIGNFFKGLYYIFIGAEFTDAFEEDDIDDEKEKKSFAKDMEAIEIVNSRNKRTVHKPVVPDEADEDIQLPDETAPVPDEEQFIPINVPLVQNGANGGDDFLFDIPLPTDHLIPAAQEEKQSPKKLPALKKVEKQDDDLEKIIEREAQSKQSELDVPVETVPAEIVEPEPEKPKLYVLPPIDLLTPPVIKSNSHEAAEEMRRKAEIIVNAFRSFGVTVNVKNILRGPSITRYEIQPGPGVKVSKIKGLEDDIALNLAAQGVRIEAPVPGKSVVGIEVPNEIRDMVTLREILSDPAFKSSKSKLTFAVGKDIAGNIILGDIAKMPHVIIAGTTGSGKSVCTRSIIMSILYNAAPDQVKLILIDPKMVEFKVFDGIPHLLIPIIIEAKKAAGALNWAVEEMMRRYRLFSEIGANNLESYNAIAESKPELELEKKPQIVVFIDELADMMLVAGKEVEDFICRLAQMGRAAGMHLVVATQRPTTDVITGLIKANIPSRIALSVMSQVDSRTIIDTAGADKLLGNGDMLYMPIGTNKPVRIQGCFASNKDITETLDFIKAQCEAEYDPEAERCADEYELKGKGNDNDDVGGDFAAGSDEDYIEKAMQVAVNAGQISTSMLQRKLKLGYARAARVMDELEERGVIGPSEGAKPRKVLMSKMQYDERRLRRMQEQDEY